MKHSGRKRYVLIIVPLCLLAIVSVLIFVGGCSQREAFVSAIAVSSDGKSVAVATQNGYIGVWDVPSRTRTSRMSLPGQAGSSSHAIAFVDQVGEIVSADHLVKDYFFAPGGASRVAFWTLPTGTQSHVTSDSGGPLALSPSAAEIAFVFRESILVVDSASDHQRRVLENKHSSITETRSLSFSADGKSIVGTGPDWLYIWDVDIAVPTLTTELDLDFCNYATFSPDGKTMIVIAGQHKLVRLLDRQTGDELRSVPWDSCHPPSLSGDRRHMVSCGHASGGVRLWQVETMRPLKTYGGNAHFSHVAITSDGKTIAAARFGQRNFDGIEVWQIGN